jgi:hypothetical protein
MNTFDGVVGSEAEVGDFFCGDAADGHLDVGGHARRSFELVFYDEAYFVVMADCVSFTEVDYIDAGHIEAIGVCGSASLGKGFSTVV